MAVLRMLFASPQLVNGEYVIQAEIDVSQVIGVDGDRAAFNVPASELLVLTADDLPGTYVEVVRTQRPNAYRAWTAEDDALLRELWREGKRFGEMTGPLGRRYGAIKSRARKLGLRAVRSEQAVD